MTNSLPIVCIGAGNFGRRVALAVHPVLFCDDNSSLLGTKVDSIPIDSPQATLELYPNATFVVAIWHPSRTDNMASRMNQLNSLGASNVTPLGSLFAEFRALLPNLFGNSQITTKRGATKLSEGGLYWIRRERLSSIGR